ncbi:hypothetical protein [Aeromonas veronii]|uniref:HEAT repeat domain-containing protein n=1 Tax=Aeromonas veronii TaxID=654 RepID=A0A4S5CGI8_AERVE|nr:hypothetical protein [Aeromonas veronii]THJ44984.1 hypothetical protein E8Q35_12405 [Aeromonas veronii]
MTEQEKIALAEHPDATVAELEQLSKDPSWEVRQVAAKHQNVPAWLLAVMSADPHPNVRFAVARFGNPDNETLVKLERDNNWLVRVGVALTEHASLDALNRLSTDKEWAVRRAVALNPHVPQSLLVTLSKDSSSIVRQTVAGSHQISIELAMDIAQNPESSSNVLQALAANETVSHKVMDVLAGDTKARSVLAQNPSLPFAMLETMTQDIPAVRCGAVKNPHLPPHILLRLALEDGSSKVRCEAVKQILECTPQAYWASAIEDGSISETSTYGKGSKKKSLCDAMIGSKLTDLYQQLQAMMLEKQIKSIVAEMPSILALPENDIATVNRRLTL